MASDLLITLEDQPGAVARVGEIMGNAGINIDGACGGVSDGRGWLHLLVTDAGLAREALAEAGIEVAQEREVEVLTVLDQPGEMGRHLRRLADAGVNLDLLYLATNTRLVLGSVDTEGLRQAIHGT